MWGCPTSRAVGVPFGDPQNRACIVTGSIYWPQFMATPMCLPQFVFYSKGPRWDSQEALLKQSVQTASAGG